MSMVGNWKKSADVLSGLRVELEKQDRWLQENVFNVDSAEDLPIEEDETVDLLDQYMAECARCVASGSHLDHDTALDHVFRVAEAGEREGALPELPGTDATEEEIQEWLEAAKLTEFVEKAIETAIEYVVQAES